jgi:signal transduction histidine kinase
MALRTWHLHRPSSASPWLMDGVVAAACFGMVAAPLTGPANGGSGPASVAAYLLAAAMAVPYLVHRRWPLPALLVCLVALLLYSLGHFAGYPGFPIFAMVFGIALHAGRRQALVGFVASALALAAALAIQPDTLVDRSSWLSSMLVLTVAWLAGENLRARRTRWSNLEERARRLEAEREERARQAVDAERMRIARDLHDVVAHAMSVVAVQAGVAHHVIDSKPAMAKQALGTIETTSRAALVELRRMLGVLRQSGQSPGALTPAPGIDDLSDLRATFTKAGLRTVLDIEGNHRLVPAGVQLSTYRIVQEALTNVLKHGGSEAEIYVSSSESKVEISVSDPGPGHRSPGPVPDGGHGLIGMRERVALFGGTLQAGPRPDGGFTVHATIPLTDPPAVVERGTGRATSSDRRAEPA